MDIRLERRAEAGIAFVELVWEFDEPADAASVFGLDLAGAHQGLRR
jgi:hypothetical protein